MDSHGVVKTTAALDRKPLKIAGTFDIECHDWSVFVVGATYDGHLPRVWYDGDAMIDYLRHAGGVWFAHAGGVFDLLYVLERARIRGIACQVDRSQHKITRIVMGSLTLRDSYALWPAPLDDLCGALRRPVPHLPWPCTCGKTTCTCGCGGCGGYCQIGARANDGDPELEDYVKADCRALYDALIHLDEFAETHAIDLKGTLGQTAWIAAQRELGIPDSEIPWEIWRHARRADKGGRVAIIRPRANGPGSHHDICNAYPAQLKTADLPVGECSSLGARRATYALDACLPGIYSLTVQVPDDLFLPPLPWNQGGMLSFPTGTFDGTWTLPELVAAFERGVSVVAVHAALIWESTSRVFAELVDRWYAIRKSVGKKTPEGQWVSRLAKALTGKFAERPERSRTVMHPETIKVCMRQGSCRDGCDGRCGAYEQIDLEGLIWAIPFSRLGPSAYPQWSAYLRAMTRVQWLEQAERYGPDLCMGNTDSLWTIGRKAPQPLGDNLGEWEYQHAWTDLEIRSPNCYAFRDEHGVLAIRGVPGLTEADWKRGHGVIDRGIVTFGAAAKTTKGLFHKRHRRWTLPGAERVWYGDRKLGDGGVTWPVDAQELRELAASRRAQVRP